MTGFSSAVGRSAARRLHRLGRRDGRHAYLFTSLAAVIVGGTSITGARGDYWRTVLGALIITVLSTALLGHGYSVGDQQIAFGLAIRSWSLWPPTGATPD